MKRLKCNDCGYVFDGNKSECPNCGCPASDSRTVSEEQPTSGNRKQNEIKHSNVHYPDAKRKPKTFEIVCYVLAGICAISFIFTSTTQSGYVNFDGSNIALRYEIAAFGWLIVGRITALINK